MRSPLTREHRSMTSSVVRILLARRRAAAAALALAAVTFVAVVACVIGITDAANAATRRQDGFGAAARVAAARAATRLAPAQPLLPAGQTGHAAK
jgi:hypothetical protein